MEMGRYATLCYNIRCPNTVLSQIAPLHFLILTCTKNLDWNFSFVEYRQICLQVPYHSLSWCKNWLGSKVNITRAPQVSTLWNCSMTRFLGIIISIFLDLSSSSYLYVCTFYSPQNQTILKIDQSAQEAT